MKKWVCMLMMFWSLPLMQGWAQRTMSYAVHANIIYHFTKYINWPETHKSGDFVIGIVGNSPLYNELIKITANKTVGNQKIIIKTYPSSGNSFEAHILFVHEDARKSLKKIVTKTAGSPTLIVGEEAGMASQGACINFAVEDEKLKLHINKNNIESRSMNIASELLKLGKLVK